MDLTSWAPLWIFSLFSVGLILLFTGGFALVKGSSELARKLGIHPIIVGLTVVAFGTSMPEFLVSVIAALRGNTDVALGNVIGSNVSNIGLILGISALVRPIDIHLKILKFEVPLLILISVFFWILCLDGGLGRLDGLSLLSGFAIYIYIVIRGAKKESQTLEKKYHPLSEKKREIFADIIYVLVGIIALTLGAKWLVDSAVEISTRMGVPEVILGLTLVALGTSLPELATSLVAALKKEGDISIGNIIGSNIFNMMAIAGPSALVHPMPASAQIQKNYLPVMILLTIILFPLLKTGRRLNRIEGALLLIAYCIIILWWTS